MDNHLKVGKAIAEVSTTRIPDGWRQGQFVFNVVATHCPEIADMLRGSMVDPFYKDHRISLFWAAVVEIAGRLDNDVARPSF
jgi:hypothetical protein